MCSEKKLPPPHPSSVRRITTRRACGLFSLFAGGLLSILLVTACGRKAPPLPPPSTVPTPTQDLQVQQRGEELLITLTYPSTAISGLALPAVESVELLELVRLATPAPLEGEEDESEADEGELIEPVEEVVETEATAAAVEEMLDAALFVSLDLLVFTPIPGEYETVRKGDLDGDGEDDLFALDRKGSLFFTTDLEAWQAIPGTWTRLTAADLDGDGSDDLIGLDAEGAFHYSTDLKTWIDIDKDLVRLASSDFDGDGDMDLAGLDASDRLFYTTDLETWIPLEKEFKRLVGGDFDGDGTGDLAATDAEDGIYYTTDLEVWTQVEGELNRIFTGNFDDDGSDDLVGLSREGELFYSLDRESFVPSGARFRRITIGNFNGDWVDDIAGVTEEGTAQYMTDLETLRQIPGTFSRLVAADLDSDGVADLVGEKSQEIRDSKKRERLVVDAVEFDALALLRLELRDADLSSAVYGDKILLRLRLADLGEEDQAIRNYAVKTASGRRKWSVLSNIVGIQPQQPPPPPRGLEVAPRGEGVEISWEEDTGDALGYHVYRREAHNRTYDEPLALVPQETTSYLDSAASFGFRYVYTVTTVVETGPTIESALGSEYEVDFEDRFPPEPPRNPIALAETDRVRVLWEPSPDEDIAGYIVFRRESEGAARPLHDEPQSELSYVDEEVVSGGIYTYEIRAIDLSDNRSEPSVEAEATVP